ncbi:MAG: hypothetical protein DCF22_20670 [Leptolyngbya sp.]|nr:MAG: hypothetical protein DCF22_20670 [Leptolyngbya sp.]
MTIPPSEPDQSPQDIPRISCFGCLGQFVYLFFLLFLLGPLVGFASMILGITPIPVAPYRIQCNDGSRIETWEVHSAERFLRKKIKEGQRCQREYTAE